MINMKYQMKGLSKEETIGSKNENQIKMPTKFYKGKGCKQCGGSGYRGRIGIFEILPMSGAIQTLAVQRAPAEKIKAQAVKEKMALMIEDGFRKVEAGLTTLEEVLRVTRE